MIVKIAFSLSKVEGLRGEEGVAPIVVMETDFSRAKRRALLLGLGLLLVVVVVVVVVVLLLLLLLLLLLPDDGGDSPTNGDEKPPLKH